VESHSREPGEVREAKLAGRGARIVTVLLLDNLAVFNAKCVEDIKRLAVGEAALGLPGNPANIARGRLSS